MKEENIKINYKTIDIMEQRGLLEITRDLGRLLTKEEFDEIMMVYKKVTDRLLAEAGKTIAVTISEDDRIENWNIEDFSDIITVDNSDEYDVHVEIG